MSELRTVLDLDLVFHGFHGFPVAGNGSDDSQPTEVNTTIKRFFFNGAGLHSS